MIALDVTQYGVTMLGHFAATTATTPGLANLTALALHTIKVSNIEHATTNHLKDNYTITGGLCCIVGWINFINYFSSGQLFKDCQDFPGWIRFSQRLTFLVSQVAMAILSVKDVIGKAMESFFSEQVCMELKAVIHAFSGVGFVMGIVDAALRLSKWNDIAVEEQSEYIAKAALDLVYAVFGGLANGATFIALFSALPLTTAALVLSSIAALLGMASAAYTAYYETQYPKEPIKRSPSAEIAATALNVLGELTQNGDNLNQGCKLIATIADGLNCEGIKEYVNWDGLDDVGTACKTFSTDLGALAIFKRISEFTVPEEDGTYFWQKTGKNDLKIAKMSFLTTVNLLDNVEYMTGMFKWDWKPLSGLLAKGKIGKLGFLALVKNIFVSISSLLGIADASCKIHRNEALKPALEARAVLWEARLNQNDVNGIEACRQNAIANLRAKIQLQNQKINTAGTRFQRVAAERAKAKLKAAKRMLAAQDAAQNFVVSPQVFATYKLNRLKAKLNNWSVDKEKGIISIINDVMKVINIATSAFGSALSHSSGAFKLTTLILKCINICIAIAKAIHEAVCKRMALSYIDEYLAEQNRQPVW